MNFSVVAAVAVVAGVMSAVVVADVVVIARESIAFVVVRSGFQPKVKVVVPTSSCGRFGMWRRRRAMLGNCSSCWRSWMRRMTVDLGG